MLPPIPSAAAAHRFGLSPCGGLGGTPISELYLLYGYAHEQLAQRGINVRRNYVGEYCTSLDMAGTSITLSRLDQEIADLLAAPAEIAIRTF